MNNRGFQTGIDWRSLGKGVAKAKPAAANPVVPGDPPLWVDVFGNGKTATPSAAQPPTTRNGSGIDWKKMRPAAPGAPAAAAPALRGSQDAPAVQPPPAAPQGPLAGFNRTMQNEFLALQQGSSPVTRNYQGNLLYQPVGELQVDDSGRDIAVTQSGQWVPFDPTKHVVFEDDDGRNIVYNRNEDSEESRLQTAGRAVGLGAVTVPIETIATAAGRLAKVLGTAAEEIPQRLIQLYTEAAKKFGDSDELARQVAGQEFGFDLSRGQASRSTKQLAYERSAERGAQGEHLRDRVEPHFEAQHARVPELQEQISARVGTHIDPATGNVVRQAARSDDAAEMLTDRVRQEADSVDRQVDQAYAAVPDMEAMPISGTKEIPPFIIDELDRAGVVLVDGLTPNAISAMKAVESLGVANDYGSKFRGKTGTPVALNLKGWEHTRRIIRTAIDGAQTATDRRATISVRKAYDKWLDNAISDQLFEGSEAAYDALKNARELRAEYGRLFEAADKGDQAGKFIEQIIDGERTVEEVGNWIFGAARGAVPAGPATRNIEKLEAIFGEGSPEWAALRQHLWAKVSVDPATLQPVSSDVLLRNLEKLLDGQGHRVAAAVFSRQQIALMRRLRGTLRNLSFPQRATNPPNSGHEAAKAIGATFGKLLQALAAAGTHTLTQNWAATVAAWYVSGKAQSVAGWIAAQRKGSRIINPTFSNARPGLASPGKRQALQGAANTKEIVLPPMHND